MTDDVMKVLSYEDDGTNYEKKKVDSYVIKVLDGKTPAI